MSFQRRSGVSKAVADDESHIPEAKSEVNNDELNGMGSECSTKDHSVSDIHEEPPKKQRISESTSSGLSNILSLLSPVVPSSDPEPVTVSVVHNSNESAVESKPDTNDNEFEVIEKDDVPLPDSVEVAEAISVQGEDGQLLVGFVQVDKDELPSASSLQVKDVAAEAEVQIVNTTPEAKDSEAPTLKAVNGGDVEHEQQTPENGVATDAQMEKLPMVESPPAPASGDVAMERPVAEPIAQ